MALLPLWCGVMVLTLLVTVSGCATLPRNAVPVEYIYDAEIPGFPNVRAWSGKISREFQADIIQSGREEPEAAFPNDENGMPIRDVLALSGGGSSGAFGAGFLNGWSAKGTRPDFKLVTGISTGALTAPFAFLGAEFDEQLKQAFTTTRTENILQRLNIFKILFKSEAVNSTGPLKQLIQERITADLLRAVAAKHDQGHRLYIGTTHMDAQRLVVWNMGLIAKSESAGALDLFHKVILASTSIPVAFPPVLIEVELDGNRYDEMHADGGTLTQVFFYGGTIDIKALRREAYGYDFKSAGGIYIIRNGQLIPEPREVDRNLRAISSRAIDTMIKATVVGDLYRIYAFTQRDGMGFHYVDIPDDYESQSKELFDKEEMNRLFEIGYQLALSDAPWRSNLPGFESMSVNK
jgi:hypothetical protein